MKKIRIQNALLKDICNIGGQLAQRVKTNIRRITPYAQAASEAVKLDAAREELVIRSEDVDAEGHIIGNNLLPAV